MTGETGGKRLYLDVCTLCRPFDDQRAMRVRLETDAFYLILRAIQARRSDMIVSPAHTAEIQAIPAPKERLEVLALVSRLGVRVAGDPKEVRKRADQLTRQGFGVADAAHVAFAEAGADCFVTCDDRLLKKCRAKKIRVRAMDPVEFCVSEELR